MVPNDDVSAKPSSAGVFDHHRTAPISTGSGLCSQVRAQSVSSKTVRWGRLLLLTAWLSLAALMIYTVALIAAATGN
jgi:hypothetical protein